MIAGLLSGTCGTRDAAPLDISVRDVVIDPYAVDGKLVRLYGVLQDTPDGAALYCLEANTEPSVETHAVAVRYSSPAPQTEEAASGSYVGLEGIFYATKPRRRGWNSETRSVRERFNGALVDARRVQAR